MLHIINNTSALTTCLRIAQSSDVILLIENGVDAATYIDAKQYSVYALKSDLIANNLLDKINSDIKVIDYDGFVDLTVENFPIQTWGK